MKLKTVLNNKFVIILIFSCFFINLHMVKADQTTLLFKQLGINETINLKTVQASKNIDFLKPKTWDISSAKLNLCFQHSSRLLENRSNLYIMVNEELIQSIELTKNNTNKTFTSVNIPADILKDFNSITLKVNQHYEDKCEDPFDPILWTSILKNSNLEFTYTKKPPKRDLALYPYPIYDSLAYNDTNLNFIVTKPDALSNDTIKSIAYIASNLSQHIKWKDLNLNIYNLKQINNKENLIVIGTPKENAFLKNINDSLPLKIKNDKFISQTGLTIDNNSGILMLIKNPADQNSVILIITGNTKEAVLKASIALIQNPYSKLLHGDLTIVDNLTLISNDNYRNWQDWITSKDSTLASLNLSNKTEKTVSAHPIEYSLNLMPDLKLAKNKKSTINVDYSNSADLDTNISTLDVIFNDISVKSINLIDDEKSKTNRNIKQVKIEIPNEHFKIYNKLVFKFNLYPIKEGYCRFVSDEHLWGTIYNTSKITIPSKIDALLPNLGLLNDGGFPFTVYPDLNEVSIILPDKLTNPDLYTLLSLLTRISKYSTTTNSFNFSITRGDNIEEERLKTDNIIVLGNYKNNKFYKQLEENLFLKKNNNKYILLNKDRKLISIINNQDIGILEEITSPWNKNRVILSLFADNNIALMNIAKVFSDANIFSDIGSGNIALALNDKITTIDNLSKDTQNEFKWEIFSNWYITIIIISVIIVIAGILLYLNRKKL